MGRPKYGAKTDANEKTIVKELRKIPGLTVILDCHDILVGYRGRTYWYEIKNPETAHNKAGEVMESRKQPSQLKLSDNYTGHWKIVSSWQEILEDIGIIKK